MSAPDFIPVCEPLLAGREVEYVTDAVSSGWISSNGSYVEAFERRFAEYVGVRHALTTTSGTTALHLACVAAGLGEGDEVIVPTITMAASAFSVCYTGARPVFVDCERATWTLDPRLLEAALTPRTRAIMPVHIYGHPCDMDAIARFAEAHGLVVIEDAAEAIGSRCRERACGGIGDLGCFSFYANKAITTGEGGMVVTDSDELYDRCRYYRNMCFPLEGGRDYWHADVGFNYRMPNTLAAIGLAQLERVDDYVAMRRANAAHYRARLDAVDGLTLPVELDWAFSSYWMYTVLVEPRFPLGRDELAVRLRERGIDTRPFFRPLHLQRAFPASARAAGQCPVAEDVSPRGLYLPSGSGLGPGERDRVCDALEELAG